MLVWRSEYKMTALDFYEVVLVVDTAVTRKLHVSGRLGIVVGKAEENGVNYYAVFDKWHHLFVG